MYILYYIISYYIKAITLHYITLYYIMLYYITLHYIILYYIYMMFIDVHYWVYFITTIDVDHSWISRSAPHIYARALEVIRSWETWDVFTNKDAG